MVEVYSEMIKKLLRLLSLMFCFTKSDKLANFTVSPAPTDSIQAPKSNALFSFTAVQQTFHQASCLRCQLVALVNLLDVNS